MSTRKGSDVPRRGRKSRAFTLRFRNEALADALRLVARAERKSMNTLIEEMVERGLAQEVAAVEADLSETLAALERYRGSAETEWAVFARAEGEVDEPIRTTHLDDPHGVKSAFA